MYSRDMPDQVVVPFHHLPTLGAFLSFSIVDRAFVAFEVSPSAKPDPAARILAGVALDMVALVLTVGEVRRRNRMVWGTRRGRTQGLWPICTRESNAHSRKDSSCFSPRLSAAGSQ